MAEREASVAARVGVAEATLGAIEKTFGELTGALADLVARRNQLERAVSEHSVRLMRLEGQIGEVENELAALDKPENGAPDVVALASAAEAAQNAVAQAEAAALRAEAAHSAARQGLDVARAPLAEAERRVGRLEAEAKALAKLIDVEAKKLWPPAIDLLTVEKGYEAALGAALGDDLEAPVDPASPIRWAGAAADNDPALPDGAEPLARHVTAPAELARRLAQIGVVDRALGADARRAIEARPAAGIAGGRSVALGRLRGRLECTDRCGAQACREEPPRRSRCRAWRTRAAMPKASAAPSRRRKPNWLPPSRPKAKPATRGARRRAAPTRRAMRMRPPSARRAA